MPGPLFYRWLRWFLIAYRENRRNGYGIKQSAWYAWSTPAPPK